MPTWVRNMPKSTKRIFRSGFMMELSKLSRASLTALTRLGKGLIGMLEGKNFGKAVLEVSPL